MAKYKRAITPEDLEEQNELEEAERLAAEAKEAEEQEKLKKTVPLGSDEEETFKKRYGDLRAHAQRKEAELNSRIEALQSQLTNATRSQLELKEVASPEDAREWISKYPEIAKIVRFIASDMNKDDTDKVKKDIEQLNEMKKNIERQRAYAKLLEIHPDFDTIRGDQKFHDWVEEKGGWVRKALYENDTDPFVAADAVTLYKTQTSKSEKKTPATDTRRQAAESVTRKSSSEAPSDGEKRVWSESYIEEMSKKDRKFFDRHEEEIMEAIRKGKFVYDITAGAEA